MKTPTSTFSLLLVLLLALVVPTACDTADSPSETTVPAGGNSADDGAQGGDGTDPAGGGLENTDALCADGLDNDGNSYTDCDDYACSKNDDVTICPDTVDGGGGGGGGAGAVDEESDAQTRPPGARL